ncbi:MAG: hypothetical protein IJ188_08625 [Clostridia bacterium]|nr:hypothetical protein [Clostridia bacterium]
MRRSLGWLRGIFIGVMLLFCVTMTGYVLLRAGMDFELEDVARSLETSQGRERKQQYEYDQVVAELPVVQAQLAEVEPLAEKAAQTVKLLKEERKQLRAEKKELEQTTEDSPAETEQGAVEP